MTFVAGESVTFKAAGSTSDPYSGETVPDWATATVALVDSAAVEPIASTEPQQDGRQSVIVGYRLYFDHAVDIDRLWRCEVRGELWEVSGRAAEWRSPFTGWEAGTVVQVGGVSG